MVIKSRKYLEIKEYCMQLLRAVLTFLTLTAGAFAIRPDQAKRDAC
jgi:hypothetical protein